MSDDMGRLSFFYFFVCYSFGMSDDQASLLTQTEAELKRRFNKMEASLQRFPSTAMEPVTRSAERVDQLVLPDEMRAKMPLTKEKFLVKENPHLVSWERQVRKFLRQLSPDHGHRVSAVMVYEWATGILIADLMNSTEPLPPGRVSWRGDLRKINKALEYYFGRPYTTYICGKKVAKAYKVKPGYYIRRHRPMTLTLWAEYQEGTLYP